MKTILLIFIISLSLNAESIHNSKCVKSFFGNFQNSTSNATILINYSDGTSISVPYSFDVINSLSLNNAKYIYSTVGILFQRCTFISSSNTLGMTNEQYTFMMALTGLLTSILLVFVIFLKV
jgi:hypothetical protein